MPDFIQKPKVGRDGRDDGMYDDDPNSLVSGSERGLAASRDAASSIDNIDDVLAENDSARSDDEQGGLGSSAGMPSRDQGSVNTPGQIASQEQSGNNVAGGNTGAAEAAILGGGVAGAEGASLFSGIESGGSIQQRAAQFLVSRFTKKNGTIGGIAGVLISGLIFFGGVATGPLELIHLAQVLEHSFSRSEGDASNRSNHLFRDIKAYRNKNIGYTRVGFLGNKIFGPALDNLEKIGVTINTNAINTPTSVDVNRGTIEEHFPDTKEMSPEEFQSWLGERLGVDGESPRFSVTGEGSNAIYSVDATDLRLSSIHTLTGNAVGLLDNGKTVSYIQTRELGKFYGTGTTLSTIFHPLSTFIHNEFNQRVNAATAKGETEEQAEKDATAAAETDQAQEVDDTLAPTEALADSDQAIVESNDSGLSATVQKIGLLALAPACVAYASTDAIVAINHFRIAATSALQATYYLAVGSQLASPENDSDVTNEQLDQIEKGLTDKNGQSVWASPVLTSESGGKYTTDSNGAIPNDLPSKYKQGYSDKGTAANIKNSLSDLLLGEPGFVCSVGALIGVVAQASAVASAAVTAPETGGLSIELGAALEQSVYQAESFGLSAAVIKSVKDIIVDHGVASKLTAAAFAGPIGGDLLAYGAREASNIGAIASGGISLANDTSTLVSDADKQDQQNFNNESMFAKVFDAKDYRSLTGHLADSISPSLVSNTASIFSTITNMGSSLGHMFGAMIPSASAAADTSSFSGNYDWGFPQYGIPDSMLNNPQLADPYANANDVANILDTSCLDGSGNFNSDCSDAQRIMSCFGNKLTYTPGTGSNPSMWDVVATTDVNPQSDDYASGNCNDSSMDWQRIVMFVNDTHTMDAIDCYAGTSSDPDTQQSCTDEGVNDNSSSDSTSTAPPSGDTASLANQVLANPKIILEPTAKADVQAAANNQTVIPGPIGSAGATKPCTARTPTYLNATLLQEMLVLAQSYTYQINDIVSGHNCDSGRHPLGRAMDIFVVNGKPYSGHWNDADMRKFASDAATDLANLLPDGKFVNGRPVNMGGIGVCSKDDISPPSNINYFVDACDELHVDVGVAP